MAQLELDRVKVLEVPEGISGRRPTPDERFHYDVLHRALYSQLLPHMRRSYRLLIDLHAGFDKEGPSADIMTGDLTLHERLQAVLSETTWKGSEKVRILARGQQHDVCTQTVIPERIWNNQEFAYVGIEVYLPESEAGHGHAVALARFLVNMFWDVRTSHHGREIGVRQNATEFDGSPVVVNRAASTLLR